MFEVAWCVTLYTTVLALEFSPLVFERFNLHVPLKVIRLIYLPLVILGVLLSTLHQSSLGTMYVIVPDKLYGLWYTPLLPVFFFISAIAAGLAVTIIESFLSARAFGKDLDHQILARLGQVMAVLLASYAVYKFRDLSVRGNLNLAFELNSKSVLFWGEMGLGCLLPTLLLFYQKIRNSHEGLFFSALLVVMGFLLNRMNIAMTGMPHVETYFPSWTEMAITFSIVVGGFVAFSLIVKFFPVFETEETHTSVIHKKGTGVFMAPCCRAVGCAGSRCSFVCDVLRS
jgi:Ni/Fe-hydrogenase subunit HybB-like protein